MFAPISVEIIRIDGTDIDVVNAARVSMAKESQFEFHNGDPVLGTPDTRLISYLARHNHWTPFAHVGLQVRISAPILVARQWFKHMVGFNRNEVSRRYVSDEPRFFIPDVIRSAPEGSIKQGSGGEHPESDTWREAIAEHCKIACQLYQLMIADGVAPEQARGCLPQWMMTEWIETGSLAGFARACLLRLDAHAQEETRQVAEPLSVAAANAFPTSWAALMGTAHGPC